MFLYANTYLGSAQNAAGRLLFLFGLEDNAGNPVFEMRDGEKMPIWGGGGAKGEGGRISISAS
jgi:hypothetical protein